MSWFTDPLCEAAAVRENAIVAYAVDFDYPSGHVRLCTTLGDLTVGADSYLGVGGIAGISGGAEKAQLVADRRVYSLSGVDPTAVPESEIDDCFARSVTEYEVWIDPETRQAIGHEINWEGRMGKVRRRDGAMPLIEQNAEHRLVILEESDGWRWTSEHQAKFFAGDTGLDHARENDSVDMIWGGFRVIPGGLLPNLAARLRARNGG